jgi:DNA-binding SARP family transcriptional activator
MQVRAGGGLELLWTGRAGVRAIGATSPWCYRPPVAIEYRLLGSLEAVDGDRRLSLGGPKQRAVLAALLMRANEIVPASRLIDDVWGDEPPETAANILQGYVSDLRRALGKETIATRGRGYAIHVEPGDLDMRRFERLAEAGIEALEDERAPEAASTLREALALWHGSALADLEESFASPAAARLEELRLGALERRIDADLALGHHTELVAELTALVAEHPLRERFRAQHMLALYRCGRQAEALDSYREARGILTEELGIDPGPALQRLEREILAQDPSLDAPNGERDVTVERPAPARIVLAVAFGEASLTDLADLGAALVRQPGYELILASLVQRVPDLTSETSRLNEVRAIIAERGVDVRAAAFTSTQPGEDVVRLTSEQDVALAVLEAPPSLLRDGVPETDLAAVLRHVPCDVALFIAKRGALDGPVVVPFGGAEHDWAAVELGAWLARARGSTLRLVGAEAAPDAGRRDASRLLFHASLAVQRAVGVSAEPLLTSPGEGGILSASKDCGLLVLGLSDRWHREGLGPARLALTQQAAPPTLLVRRGLRPGGLAPREHLTRFTWSVAPALS